MSQMHIPRPMIPHLSDGLETAYLLKSAAKVRLFLQYQA